MLLLRRIFFYLFVTLYVIFCPVIIWYALGYIYRPGAEEGIVKSGLIYLSTAPPGATVYLGNRRYTKRTPAVLSSLYPGEYPVKLVLKNHQPWSEELPVERGKATVLEKILLLPETWDQNTLFSEPFDDLTLLPGKRFFLLKNGPNIEDFFIYDLKEDKKWPLLPPAFLLRGAKVSSRFMATGGPAFLLRIDSKNGDQYLWIMIRGKEVQAQDLTDFFLTEPHSVDWDPQEKRYLFFLQDEDLNRVDLLSKAVTPKFLDHVRSYGLFGKKLYVLRDNGVLERFDLEGRREKPLFQDPLINASLIDPKERYQIHVFSDDFILLLGENGELIGNRAPYKLVEEGVLGLEFYPKLKRVLVWKKNELGILDLSKEHSDKEPSSTEVTWILRQGEKLGQAFWVYEGSHVVFRDKNKVFLLELETYAKPHLRFLIEVKNKSSIFYSEETGKLYFLDSTNSQLKSLEILPRLEILPLPFPERKEEKKKMELGQL